MKRLNRPSSISTTLLATALIATLSAGCAPPWRVVRQANPNPMMGQKNFLVDNIHFENLMIGRKTVQEYLAGKDQKQQDSFNADLLDGNKIFGASLLERSAGLSVQMAAAPAPGTFFVRPTIGLFEPGNFNAFVNIPTQVNLKLEVLNDQGVVLDEIVVACREDATLYNPASGTRFRQCTKRLGYIAARYIGERAGTNIKK